MKKSSHTFALYWALLPTKIPKDGEISIADTALVHRISRVLRLSVGDTLILFNRVMQMEITITSFAHATITGVVKALSNNTQWRTKITFFLPLLKRDALSAAIYNLVEAGVDEIQLITTQKVHRDFGGKKEIERLERIVIAAAEQSKNFVFPVIKEPISLRDALALVPEIPRYVAAPDGIPFCQVLECGGGEVRACALFVGPEGDFTPEEWRLLKAAEVMPVQLTPTVLRAETAAFFIAAIFRSIFSDN